MPILEGDEALSKPRRSKGFGSRESGLASAGRAAMPDIKELQHMSDTRKDWSSSKDGFASACPVPSIEMAGLMAQ